VSGAQTLRVTITRPTTLQSAIGIHRIRVTKTATADLLQGVTGPEGWTVARDGGGEAGRVGRGATGQVGIRRGRLRCRSFAVASLLAPTLSRVGLRRYPADNGAEGEVLLVPARNHVTRSKLAEVIGRALETHPDAALRLTAEAPTTIEEITPLVPDTDVPSARGTYSSRPVEKAVPVAAVEHVTAFVATVEDRERRSSAYARYVEDACLVHAPVVARRHFCAVAAETGLVDRRRAAEGHVFRRLAPQEA
jgi:hypothetical protein